MSTRKNSGSKKPDPEIVRLVCGRSPSLPNSVAAKCSDCGHVVFGTRGSVERAQREGFPLVCEDCFDKLDDPKVVGVMHQGKMLSDAETQAFVENWFANVLDKHLRN